MRRAFIGALLELAERDERIVLLTADLGFSVLEEFGDRFPGRFFNVGVAEQNMVGLATGLAEAGFVPFVYSIATFASMRAYELLRNGPILHGAPVRVVAVGGGFEYGEAGHTHHALEDIGIMRLQPHLTVVCPADHRQAVSALHATVDLPGPVYYRIGKNDEATVPGLDGRFRLGRCDVVREGGDVLVLCVGGVAPTAVAAAAHLADAGIAAGVAVVSTLNPPPADLAALVGGYRVVVTTEGHYAVGGLGSLVSEVVAGTGAACRVVRCGVGSPPDVTGGEAYLNRLSGLSAPDLAAAVVRGLETNRVGWGG